MIGKNYHIFTRKHVQSMTILILTEGMPRARIGEQSPESCVGPSCPVP